MFRKQALGFTLHSEAAAFVDLGTEFGVEVDRAGRRACTCSTARWRLCRGNGARRTAADAAVGLASQVSSTDQSTGYSVSERVGFSGRVPASAYELAVLKSPPAGVLAIGLGRVECATITSEGRIWRLRRR